MSTPAPVDLRGSTAVVTGAAQGLGLAMARELARGGARVVLADVQVEKAGEAAAGLLEDGLEYERLRGVMIKGTATLVDDEKGLHDLARAVVEHNQPGLDPDLLDVAAAHLTVKRTGVMVEPHKVVSWDHTKLADHH